MPEVQEKWQVEKVPAWLSATYSSSHFVFKVRLHHWPEASQTQEHPLSTSVISRGLQETKNPSGSN